MTCDTVLSYDIVLPDASTATVTATSHPDLYFALRGAGQGNFGIVTSFTYETIALPNRAGLWDAVKTYSWDKVPALIDAWHTVHTESLAQDLDVGGFNPHCYVQAYDSWLVVDRYVHTAHADNTTWPAIWAPFEQIEALPDTTRVSVRHYSDITVEIGAASPHGGRNIYATFSFSPSAELTAKILAIFQEEIEPIKAHENVLPCLIFQPFASNTIALMSRRGGNALGLTPADGPLVIASIAWSWKNAADDAEAFAAYRKFFARAEAVAKEMGLWHRFKYANYAEASQDVWGGYGEENMARLRKIQREVDPLGVFIEGGLAGGGLKLNVKEEGAGAAKGRMTDRKSEL